MDMRSADPYTDIPDDDEAELEWDQEDMDADPIAPNPLFDKAVRNFMGELRASLSKVSEVSRWQWKNGKNAYVTSYFWQLLE
jgi:hypothetical protein